MSEQTISILVGSTRKASLGKEISKNIQALITDILTKENKLNAFKINEYTPLEPYNLLMEPINQLPPLMINTVNGGESERLTYESEIIRDYSKQMESTDLFVFVVPVYNYSYSGGFKIMMDHLFAEFKDKPVLVVGYGLSLPGTVTCVAQVDALVAKFGMKTVGSVVSAQKVHPYTGEGCQAELVEALQKLIN
ncbi:hypothetical protein C6P40_003629 [Pichia californica]|uniref:NADPH-dependent FMN reductase-like domain-containing protein n=1 Tax=Pichia californica TaxID=460514 RepID=A0A9P6WIF7_9ASCO|nr:hypothetical protein C6P42_002231 [[Candida] californica]KAG0686653.1 hypothetical protein C6P40_003629 [[Candida] californica]